MSRLHQSLVRDERGASVIEMALVMPFFAAMIIGMTDISRAYSSKLQLEQAAQRAIEKVQQYQTPRNTFDTLSAEASEAAVAAGFPTNTVTVDAWLECNGVRQADYTIPCPPSDTYGRWVTVNISADWTPLFASRLYPGSNANGSYTITGKAGTRTQ